MTHTSPGTRQQKERFTVVAFDVEQLVKFVAFDVEERVKYTRPL